MIPLWRDRAAGASLLWAHHPFVLRVGVVQELLGVHGVDVLGQCAGVKPQALQCWKGAYNQTHRTEYRTENTQNAEKAFDVHYVKQQCAKSTYKTQHTKHMTK